MARSTEGDRRDARTIKRPFDPKDYGAKVGEIITRHLSVEGVEQLLAKRDILDPAFKQHLDSLSSAEAKAAEIEHAIRHEIHVHRDENPAAYTSLWEQLEKIVNEQREARVSAASTLARLEEIAAQVSGVRAGWQRFGQWPYGNRRGDPAFH